MKYFVLLFILSVGLVSTLSAQTGKEFWFAVPYIDKSHDSDNTDDAETGPNYFRISTGEAGARVTFYYFPNGGSANKTKLYSVVVEKNSVATVTLADDGTEDFSLVDFTNSTFDAILDRGIYIKATNSVTIYYEIGSYNNTDIFALKGKDALGTEFYPAYQNRFKNKSDNDSWATDSWESASIVATEDGTNVCITTPGGTSGGILTELDTVYKTVTEVKTFTAGNILYPVSSTSCTMQSVWEEFYTVTTVAKLKNDDTLSVSDADTTWIIDTNDVNICCDCGKTVYNTWADTTDSANIISISNFNEQLNYGGSSGSWAVATTTVTDSVVSNTTATKQQFLSFSATSITLDQGETYAIRASVKDAVKAFDGIVISSDKDIAITFTDDSAIDSLSAAQISGDVIGDQGIPSVNAGTKYLVPDFDVGNEDMDIGVYLRAIEDNTEINIDGETNPVATLDAGEVYAYYNFNREDSYKYIYTNDKPVVCFQIAGFPSTESTVTELSGAYIPPVDQCTGSTQSAFNIPQNYDYKIAIIARTEDAGTFKYKGEDDSDWTEFYPTFTGIDTDGDGTEDWFFSLAPNFTPTVAKNYIIKNTNATFHLGILSEVQEDEDNQGTFYGYYSDFTTPELQVGFDTLADGRVQLYAFGGVEGSYTWSLIDPTPASDACIDHYLEESADCRTSNPIILDASILTVDGTYTYEATGTSTCDGGDISDTVTFKILSNSAYLLPVGLNYFTAALLYDNIVSLNWEVCSETNNDFYIIERSADGYTYETIATVDGYGTSSVTLDYSLTDKLSTPGIYYYRLSQQDFDGKLTKLYTTALSYSSNVSPDIPSVISGQEYISTPFFENVNNLSVQYISADGKCILKKNFKSGTSEIPVPGDSGMFCLQINTDDASYTYTIILK